MRRRVRTLIVAQQPRVRDSYGAARPARQRCARLAHGRQEPGLDHQTVWSALPEGSTAPIIERPTWDGGMEVWRCCFPEVMTVTRFRG
jgi:hypothetical protein